MRHLIIAGRKGPLPKSSAWNVFVNYGDKIGGRKFDQVFVLDKPETEDEKNYIHALALRIKKDGRLRIVKKDRMRDHNKITLEVCDRK